MTIKLKATVGRNRKDDLYVQGPVRLQITAETKEERQALLIFLRQAEYALIGIRKEPPPSDARRTVGKWLNEQPNRELDPRDIARLCFDYDMAVAALATEEKS